MARVKTFADNGSLLPGDFNAIEDDYEALFSTWKTIDRRGEMLSALTAGEVAYLKMSPQIWTSGVDSHFLNQVAIDFDPSDYVTAPRACKMRLRALLSANQVAPGTTLTLKLHTASITHGVTGGADTVSQGGLLTTISFGSVAASSFTQQVTAEFDKPTADMLVLSLTAGATALASGSRVDCRATLQVRAV